MRWSALIPIIVILLLFVAMAVTARDPGRRRRSKKADRDGR